MYFLWLALFFGSFWVVFSKLKKKNKTKQPPVVGHSMFRALRGLTGNQSPTYILDLVKEYGPVFYLPLPSRSPHYVVASPKLARMILEGGNECEKANHIYSRLNDVTCGYSTIFTKNTEGEGWAGPRKACAPCFSMSNIERKLPELRGKVKELCEIIGKFADSGESITKMETWFVKLTLDFISSSMFGVDFQALGGKSNNEMLKSLDELQFILN